MASFKLSDRQKPGKSLFRNKHMHDTDKFKLLVWHCKKY